MKSLNINTEKRFIQDFRKPLHSRFVREGCTDFSSLYGIGSGSEVRSSGEQEIFHVLKKMAKKLHCIFDVGSNKGQFLQLILENIAVDNYSIYCFGARLETFKSLIMLSKKIKKLN